MLQADSANIAATALSGLGAILMTGALGMFKRTDSKVAQNPVFRKLQPVITLAGALAAPYVAQLASSGVDISGLGNAPVTTLGAVVLCEFLAMVKRSV